MDAPSAVASTAAYWLARSDPALKSIGTSSRRIEGVMDVSGSAPTLVRPQVQNEVVAAAAGGRARTSADDRQSRRYVTDPMRGPSNGDPCRPMTIRPA